MKIFLKTYGCQANISDSELIAGILTKSDYNYKLVDSESEADLILVNSCSVKNSTQSKILDYIKKYYFKKKIAVGGCLPKALDLRQRFPKLISIFDTNSLFKVPQILKEHKDAFSNEKELKILNLKIRKNKSIAIIPIAEGCLNSCTYCATKLARGNLKSYRIKDIKKEFEKALKEGCKKIYLTSQDNGCYGFDLKTNLVELLKELTSLKGDYIIRVGMMNPFYLKKLLPDLTQIYKSKKIIKFLHIPLQSGSDKILKDMKRSYKVKDFKFIVTEFRKLFPQITIATDVIVGYPTETEEDFEKTYNLIKELKPQVLNISKFSSRLKTEASKLKQLKSKIIDARSKKLSKLYQEIKEQI